MKTAKEEVCCPPFNPGQWNDVTLEWSNKPFIRDAVNTIFYIPLNFGVAMRRLDKKCRDANAVFLDNMCLSHHRSKWKMDLFMAVDKALPDAVTMSGKYYCKVYEGDFRNSGKWMQDFEQCLKKKGVKQKRVLNWYTTCPECAKKYGKNYVVLLAEH